MRTNTASGRFPIRTTASKSDAGQFENDTAGSNGVLSRTTGNEALWSGSASCSLVGAM
jgi:hypothetical protein